MKGKTNNPNGRPKGRKNKATLDLRQRINNFVIDKWDSIEADFEALEPKERLQFFEKLLQYSLPKLQSVVPKEDIDDNIEVIITFWKA